MNPPALEYVALVVDDPCASASFFEHGLGLARRDARQGDRTVPVVAVGSSAFAFFAQGDPFLGGDAVKGVHHVAIAAEDPGRLAADAGLRADAGAAAGLDGRAHVRLCADRTAGVRTWLTEPLAIGHGGSPLVERIDHLGVASTDNSEAEQVFVGQLGCVYESRQTDSEFETLVEQFTSDRHPMVVHHRPSRLRGSLRVTFITVGDCEFEFLQDLTATVEAEAARHDAAGNTRGDRSAIARYVARRGAGLHHVALKTPDIDRTLEALERGGHRLIDRAGRPGSRRARIGFVHPSATGGVLLHFVEREEL